MNIYIYIVIYKYVSCQKAEKLLNTLNKEYKGLKRSLWVWRLWSENLAGSFFSKSILFKVYLRILDVEESEKRKKSGCCALTYSLLWPYTDFLLSTKKPHLSLPVVQQSPHWKVSVLFALQNWRGFLKGQKDEILTLL